MPAESKGDKRTIGRKYQMRRQGWQRPQSQKRVKNTLWNEIPDDLTGKTPAESKRVKNKENKYQKRWQGWQQPQSLQEYMKGNIQWEWTHTDVCVSSAPLSHHPGHCLSYMHQLTSVPIVSHILRLGLPPKVRSENILRNRSATVFIILWKKCAFPGIPCVAK